MNSKNFEETLLKRISLYLLIGGIATGFNYLCFILFFGFFNFHELISSSVAYLAGLLISYPLNKKMTFKQTRNQSISRHEVIKYVSVYLITLVLGLLFFDSLVKLTPLSPYIIQAAQLALVTIVNFYLLNRFVFK